MTTEASHEEVHFTSGGTRCAADLYLPEGAGASSPLPGIVMGHGFTLVKEMLVSQATAFRDAGYLVLAIDY